MDKIGQHKRFNRIAENAFRRVESCFLNKIVVLKVYRVDYIGDMLDCVESEGL